MYQKCDKKAFTLIEMLIVIAIIGILATLGFSSYMNSVKSSRDARRKSDLNNIQKALELYYQDNERYPDGPLPINASLCHPDGCDTANYMQSVPQDPSGYDYAYISDGTSYQLYSCIENANDSGPGVKNYAVACGTCNPCRFGLSSPNTTP